VVLDNLKKSDFTVLLRSETARNTKAGFPTKVIESISTGTPVIMNYTSDLVSFFHDGKECIQVKGYTAKAFCDALRQALSLSKEERIQMSENAKGLACKFFDVSSYYKEMGSILGCP
jgi:glycosyltransferase involved in cell wall biosynthesis